MRKYKDQKRAELSAVICNMCGKELKVENEILKEGCLALEYTFDYFSRKDGQRHRLDLCEECYDKWIAGFCVPVETEEMTELV